MELVFRINRYFNALDGRDFDYCLDCFTPLFDADYTSMVGGEPLLGLPRETNMQAWKGMIAGFSSTQHLVGNHDVSEIDASTAAMTAKVIATHVLLPDGGSGDGNVWVAGGTYNFRLEKSPDDCVWRIRAVKFSQSWCRGSPALMAKAAERATSAAAVTATL